MIWAQHIYLYQASLHCHSHQPVLYPHSNTWGSQPHKVSRLSALKFRWQLLHCPKSLWDTSGGLMPRPWREKIVNMSIFLSPISGTSKVCSVEHILESWAAWASTMIVITINYDHLLNSPSILIPNALPIGRPSLLSQAYQLRVPEKVVQLFPASRCVTLCLESPNKQSSPRLISLR